MISRRISELPQIRSMGRNGSLDGSLVLFWTASGLDFCFRGSEIATDMTADYSLYEPWIAVEVDGVILSRRPLEKGQNRVTLIRGLTPENIHRIRIFKATQAMEMDRAAALWNFSFSPIQSRSSWDPDSIRAAQHMLQLQR